MLSPVLIWPHFDPTTVVGERAVQRRLAPARHAVTEARSTLALAALALGIEAPPAAALTCIAEGRSTDPTWFLAEPVMLIPDRDRLLLRRLGGDGLSAAEAQALIGAAHEHFPAAELRLERAAPGHWYARFGSAEARAGLAPEGVEETPVDITPEIFGLSMEGVRELNELQMLWYEHSVNRVRREAGRLQANALWVWGGGALPPVVPSVNARVLAAQAQELRGLAQWLHLEHRMPETALVEGVEQGLMVAVGAGEEALGRRWLTALAGQRGRFLLFASGRMWEVPARAFWRHW
jgi:hypothetical protein